MFDTTGDLKDFNRSVLDPSRLKGLTEKILFKKQNPIITLKLNVTETQ